MIMATELTIVKMIITINICLCSCGQHLKKSKCFFITKVINHKFILKVRSFNSAKLQCIYNHVKATLIDVKPENIIFQVGTNDLNFEKTSSQIAR